MTIFGLNNFMENDMKFYLFNNNDDKILINLFDYSFTKTRYTQTTKGMFFIEEKLVIYPNNKNEVFQFLKKSNYEVNLVIYKADKKFYMILPYIEVKKNKIIFYKIKNYYF